MRYIWRAGRFVPKPGYEGLESQFAMHSRRNSLQAPSIISDSLGVAGLKSMADGRTYDSKSEMRKGYRRRGVEEVGDDPEWTGQREPSRWNWREEEKTTQEIRGSLEWAASQVDLTPDANFPVGGIATPKSMAPK